MSNIDWQRVQDIFTRAVEAPEAARGAVVEELARGDSAVIVEVKRMLRADAGSEGFLEALPLAGPEEPAGTDAHDLSGARVGSYTLVRTLGHGGMGSVWLAEREDGGVTRRVAIKVIKRGMDTDDVVRRFANERRVLSALEHPNIARLIDAAALPDGRPAIIMELVEGVRIDRYCDTHALSVRERLALFQRVCAAVEHAHNQLIVHRDIKPSNILVTDTGDVKLFDFGIAKLLARDDDLTQTAPRHRILTPRYASPEQARGEPVTTSSDVYSLGVVLYELLTGRAPFERNQPDSTRSPTRPSDAVTKPITRENADGATSSVDPARVSRARGVEPERLRRILSGDLDTILLTALHAEPSRRYARAADLAEDIRRYLEDLPVKAREDTRSYRVAKFFRRNRGPVAAGGSLIALGTIAIVVLSVLLVRTNHAEQTAAAAVTEANEQRTIAVARMRESDKAVEFLTRVVLSATPDESDGVNPESLASILAIIERRASKDLADEPRVRARVEHALGRGYRSIGKLPQATRALDTAIRLESSLQSSNTTLLADSLNERGMVYLEEGNPTAAIAHFERALDTYIDTVGQNDKRTAWAVMNLGNAFMGAGRLEEAAQHFSLGVEIAEAAFPPGHDNIIHARSQQLGALFSQNRFEETVPLLHELIAAAESSPAFPRSALFAFRNNLAVSLNKIGDHEGAVAVHDRLVPEMREYLGPDHPRTLQAESNRAAAIARAGRSSEAEQIYLDILSRVETSFGPDNERALQPLTNLATLLDSQDRLAEAEDSAKQALRLVTLLRGPDNPEVSLTRLQLARIQLRSGSAPRRDVIAAIERSVAELTDSLGPDHPSTKHARQELDRARTSQ